MIVQPRETVIDLGVLRSADAPDTDIPPPVGPRWRTGSRLAAAVLMAAAGATVAGVPHPASPAIRHVLAIPAKAESLYTVTGDALYVVTPDQDWQHTTITAHDLRTGSKRWSTEVDGRVYLWGDGRSATVLAMQENHTQTLEDGTGAVRWQWAGTPAAVTDDRLLLADRDEDGHMRGLRLVNADTGESIWSRAIPGLGWFTTTRTVTGPREWQYIVAPVSGGWTVVYRFSDGVEISRARLGLRTIPPDDDADAVVDELIGGVDVVYISRVGRSGTMFSAYRPETMTRLWRRAVTADARDCGPVVCLADGAKLSALDARTGATLWTRPGPAHVESLGTDLLIESQGDDWVGPESAVLDARTGRVVTGLAPYRRIDGSPELLMRPDRVAPGLSVVARLDPVSGALTNLGRVPGVWANCQASGPYVLCRAGDQVQVWTTAGR